MHIHSMNYFLAVADLCSFTQAALEKNISQSSLSKHIKLLEDEFRVTLFDRSTHQLRLTEAGAVFYSYAERIISHYNMLQSSMEQYHEDGMHTLRISCAPILHLYGITDMIFSFKRSHPHFQLHLQELPLPSNILEMERRNVDLAIVRSTIFPQKEHYAFFPLVYDELVFVCNRSHRLAGKAEVSIPEILHEDFALLRHGLFDYIKGLKQMGYDIDFSKSALLLQNSATVLRHLMEEDCVSLLMGAMADLVTKGADSLVKIPFVEHPPFPVAIVADNRDVTQGARSFIEHAKAFFMERNGGLPSHC